MSQAIYNIHHFRLIFDISEPENCSFAISIRQNGLCNMLSGLTRLHKFRGEGNRYIIQGQLCCMGKYFLQRLIYYFSIVVQFAKNDK